MGCKLHFHDIASFTRTRFNRNIMGCKGFNKPCIKYKPYERFNRNIMGCKERIIERLFDDSGDLIGT